MNLTRIWIAGGAVAIAAVLAGGWLLGVQPMLAAVDDNRAQQGSVAALVSTQEHQLAELKRQDENRDLLEADVDELRAALPAEADLPALVGELADLATSAGVRITDLGTSDAQQVDVPAAGTAPAAGKDAGTATAKDAGTATAKESGKAHPAAPASGTIAIPVQITATGDEDRLLAFVGRVQHAKRLLLPSGISLSLPKNGDQRQVSLSVFAYVSPQP
jgi:Tfp pilus assembly protein PilO